MTHLLPLPTLPGVTFEYDAPLAPRTTYKLGGPADVLATVDDEDGLLALLALLAERELPWLVLGNGSNVLVSDAGYRGCVVILGDGFKSIGAEGDGDDVRIAAGAAVSVTRLLRFARAEGLGGLSLLGGVPGTVGGVVRMNAGTRWGQTSDILASARLVSANGAMDRDAADLGLAYRTSALPEGAVVVSARFRVSPASEASLADYDEVLAYRKATQPLQFPSCGSVFANPEGDAAGRLIEAVGLKGHRIGGALVAPQHANWILAEAGATAADVHALIRLARARVLAETGIALRPEVQFIGSFPALDAEAEGGRA